MKEVERTGPADLTLDGKMDEAKGGKTLDEVSKHVESMIWEKAREHIKARGAKNVRRGRIRRRRLGLGRADIVRLGVPTALEIPRFREGMPLWIPAFAGITGENRGNDGQESRE